jgi:hypothetical protein
LFSSTSQDELGQIDDPGSDHYFDKVDLSAETISLPKIRAAVSMKSVPPRGSGWVLRS